MNFQRQIVQPLNNISLNSISISRGNVISSAQQSVITSWQMGMAQHRKGVLVHSDIQRLFFFPGMGEIHFSSRPLQTFSRPPSTPTDSIGRWHGYRATVIQKHRAEASETTVQPACIPGDEACLYLLVVVKFAMLLPRLDRSTIDCSCQCQ